MVKAERRGETREKNFHAIQAFVIGKGKDNAQAGAVDAGFRRDDRRGSGGGAVVDSILNPSLERQLKPG